MTTARTERPRLWWLRKVPAFMTVGMTCTAAYFGLYLLLRDPLGAQWANLVSLVLSTIAVTSGNRRFTFGVTSRRTVVPHQVLGLAVLALNTVLTASSLWLLHQAAPDAGRVAEVGVLAVANGIGGCVRFATYAWVMREDP